MTSVFTARCYAKRSVVESRLSVCPSVCNVDDCGHMCWVYSYLVIYLVTWCGHTSSEEVDAAIRTWRTLIHEEVHLDWTSSFQCSFETINRRLINIILRQLVPSVYNSFWKEIFPDIKLAPVLCNLPRVTSCSAVHITIKECLKSDVGQSSF